MYVLRIDTAACAQFERYVERWMEHAGARIELDRDPWLDEKKRLAKSQEIAIDPVRAGRGEKPHRVLENIFRGREAVGRQGCGNHTIFRCAASVESFGHRTATSAQTGSERTRNTKGMVYRARLKFEEMGARGGGAKGTEGSRGMKAVQIMIRLDRVA